MTDNDEKAESAFDRFRDLARKLVQVPKHEADVEQPKEREHREDERRG